VTGVPEARERARRWLRPAWAGSPSEANDLARDVLALADENERLQAELTIREQSQMPVIPRAAQEQLERAVAEAATLRAENEQLTAALDLALAQADNPEALQQAVESVIGREAREASRTLDWIGVAGGLTLSERVRLLADEFNSRANRFETASAEAATLREALETVLDCGGPYKGLVSRDGGEPAVCPLCVERARAVLAAGATSR
jgi:hypothetical protein